MPNETKTYNWIDPNTIPTNGDILIVLVDDRNGFLGWFIKTHEAGNYNHEMGMRKLGMIASQNDVFKEISVSVYQKKNLFLKFWKLNLTDEQKAYINTRVDKVLARPWWQRGYDYLGLFGQAIKIGKWKPFGWLTIPGEYFCSEFWASTLTTMPNPWKMVVSSSPSEFNVWANQNPDKCQVLGYWFED